MPREIEIKLRVLDPAPVRATLAAVGAAAQGAVFEENSIFDRPDRSLLKGGCGLRVRVCYTPDRTGLRTATLTFKGPRAPGRLKNREEWETDVTCPESAAAILMQLGYHPAIVYEKRRETWRFGACEIVLDELPRMGWFVEIEGPDEAIIRLSRETLGLGAAVEVLESYVALAAARGDRDASGVAALRF